MADTEPTEAQRADDAFNILAHALDLAMMGKFPLGFSHLDYQMQVRGAAQYLGALLKKVYPEVKAPEGAEEPAETEPAAETEPEPVAS